MAFQRAHFEKDNDSRTGSKGDFILNMNKLRLRGFSGAQDEFLLAATAQNLRRMAKWLTPEAPEEKIMPA